MTKWLIAFLLLAIPAAHAQHGALTKEEEAEYFRRLTKECELTAAEMLPKVPGLTIVRVNSTPPTLEVEKGAYRPAPWTYATNVEIQVQVLARTEAFQGLCIYVPEKGPRILKLYVKP